MTFNVNDIVQQAKRTRASRTAGKIRRAAFGGPGLIPVCNRERTLSGKAQRCCRPLGHKTEHVYVDAIDPLPPHRQR